MSYIVLIILDVNRNILLSIKTMVVFKLLTKININNLRVYKEAHIF